VMQRLGPSRDAAAGWGGMSMFLEEPPRDHRTGARCRCPGRRQHHGVASPGLATIRLAAPP
jgi:hypothetical protein